MKLSTQELARYEIEFTYAGLAEGTSDSGQVCPACKGGSEQEKSLSVSRSGGVLLYNCHRSSCGFRGAIGNLSGFGGTATFAKGIRRVPYIEVSQLTEEATSLLAEKYGLTREAIDFAGLGWVGERSDNYGRRVSFPIWGPDNRERGKSYRSYEGGKPKAIINLRDENAIGQSWYKFKRRADTLVVFEDQVSAIRVAPFTHTVSLLGVNLSEEKLREIIDGKYRRVYLCLDADATDVSVRTSLKYRTRLPQLQIRGLSKDVKDMNQEEFDNFIKDIKDEHL